MGGSSSSVIVVLCDRDLLGNIKILAPLWNLIFLIYVAIGIGLVAIGFSCFALGVMMFLDRGMLAIGNVSKNESVIFGISNVSNHADNVTYAYT